ncbi:hypothetical protein HX079_18620 [Myroides odoratimimus]|nr:hypothetical protein [Myroides odoratimimus]MDM1507766.1 hypothetical protein [Myroides odoratimimus]
MKRVNVFYCSIGFVIIGISFIGIGIGKLFDKICEGILIGVGFGLFVGALIMYRTYKKLVAYNKK